MRHLAIVALFLSTGTGCVIVNPRNVQVGGSYDGGVARVRENPGEAPYAAALHRVLRQQRRVADEFQQQDWNDLADESNDWASYTRVLAGYADTTNDPRRFRSYCDQLLAQSEAMRTGAVRRDPMMCDRALRGSDPILNRLSQEFPTQVNQAQASPPPPAGPATSVYPPPARPTTPPPPTPRPQPSRSAVP